jgi:hypothetical protein
MVTGDFREAIGMSSKTSPARMERRETRGAVIPD